MTVDPSAPKTGPGLGRKPDPQLDPGYAHTRDPQAQRSRFELWVILAIVVAVVAGSILWRAVTGQGPQPQAGWNRSDPRAAVPSPGTTPAAAAGLPPHGVGASPAPRPGAP